MLTPPSSIVQEMHKLHSSGALLYLAAIPSFSVYLARSLADIAWNGTTYQKSWFEVDGIAEDADSHAPELLVHFSNLGGMVEAEVLASNNFAKALVTLYVVNSNCLDEVEPIYSVTLQVQKVTCTKKLVSFKLGLSNPLLVSFPSWKFHGSICQYAQFKGELCGYTGALTTCDRTLTNCLERANTERFGAQPGLLGSIQADDGL